MGGSEKELSDALLKAADLFSIDEKVRQVALRLRDEMAGEIQGNGENAPLYQPLVENVEVRRGAGPGHWQVVVRANAAKIGRIRGMNSLNRLFSSLLWSRSRG